MRNKILSVSLLFIACLCLTGCSIRITGPCLGYGCPAGTRDGEARAVNTARPSDVTHAGATDSKASAEMAAAQGRKTSGPDSSTGSGQ